MKHTLEFFAHILKADPDNVGDKVESFVVDGALDYFASIEDYRTCQVIMNFKKFYPNRIVNISKE